MPDPSVLFDQPSASSEARPHFRRGRWPPAASRGVAAWLWIMTLLVFALVLVGGATRLTGSGLSITEWRPITGLLPPLSEAQWSAEFDKYRRIPQFQRVNSHIGLAEFQVLYGWEWTHRSLARFVGAAFLIPFLFVVVRGRLPRRLMWACASIFLLGAVQAGVGWWMVRSGLSDRIDVAPARLATHMLLGAILVCALVWTALEASTRPTARPVEPAWRGVSILLGATILLQIGLGALVAGNGGGLVHGDWPLMGGRLVPDDYFGGQSWRALVGGQAAVQFNHRMAAYGLLAAAGLAAVGAAKSTTLPLCVKAGFVGVLLLLLAQAALGVAILRTGVAVGVSLAHQALAIVILAAVTALAWRLGRVAPMRV